MNQLFEELRGSELVAKFQRTCGLRIRDRSKKDDEKNSSSSTNTNNANPAKDTEFEIEIGHKWLHYLFLFGTSLGDELFYSVFFTFWFWNVDGAVGRRVVLVWAICMYIGQSLKDIIRWPRPSSPPVVKLERKWELEYGMPSTHAIVGAAVPIAIIIFTSSRYQYSVGFGIAVSLTLCGLICMSRLYLGMHSFLDIIAGLLLVATLLPVVIPLVDRLDGFFFTHEMGGLSLVALGIFLCLSYPSGDRWTPARGDTYVIVGSAIGMTLGAWMNYQLGFVRGPPPSSPPYVVMWPTWSMILLAILRQCLGLVFVLSSKVLAKSAINFGIRRIIQDESSTIKNPGIITELFTKFLTYTIVGLTVTHVAPNVFRVLSMERPTFHTEI